MSKYLIVNPGSTSKKYAFYIGENDVFGAHLEMEEGIYIAHLKVQDKEGKIRVSENDFKNPHKQLFLTLKSYDIVNSKEDISAIAVRIVAPGAFFQDHKLIDESYIESLKKAEEIAPLHIGPVLHEISLLEEEFPGVKIYGISDSAFHKTLPDTSKYYGIAKEDSDKFEIKKFGYHGISLESIIAKLENMLGAIPPRTIICHLGGGASMTAVLNGKSIDTTMGFSPLEGLIMANRVGDIDSGALIYLAEKLNLNYKELEDYLNHKSGLRGISTKSSDIRELLELEEKGDLDAKLALDIYVYKIKKYIGAYYSALGGLDLLVFSGTVGERSFIMREKICKNMNHLCLLLNEEMNNHTFEKDAFVQTENSPAKIGVIKTDEVGEMARIVRKIS